MVQDFDIFCLESLFFLRTLLKISKQGISSFVSFALIIIDLKMVMREFLGPANLLAA